MKVQCSSCEAAEAVLVCCADEAALCSECDTRIHEANKLASKHNRVPLVRPSKPTQCDICQEKPGYFFCLQDRALLCHGCDMSIHLSNASTSNHRRFLVTGVTASLHPVSSSQQASAGEGPSSPATPSPSSSRKQAATSTRNRAKESSSSSSGLLESGTSSKATEFQQQQEAPCTPVAVPALRRELSSKMATSGSSKTSILEFLTETVPGWKFDELVNLTDTTNYLQVEAHSQLEAGLSWYPTYSNEQMYSRSVPQVGASGMTPAATWALNRGISVSNTVQQQQQQQQLELMMTNKVTTAGYGGLVATTLDDAFMVPDLGMQAEADELLVPSTKRRRYCYSELDNMFLSS